jgi:hypothetical protein
MVSSMTPELILFAHITKALAVFALAGILCRRRAPLCWTFVAYLLTVLVFNSLFTFWPEHFFKRWIWILHGGILDALRMGIAVELSLRTFQAFPNASATARRMLLVLLLATSAALVGMPLRAIDNRVLLEWHPRVLTGTIWLMTGLALLITWYRVPLHAYHKAILLGFVPYLLVFATAVSLFKQHGWINPLHEWAEPIAYIMLMGFWAHSSWRPDTQLEASPAIVRMLQPWRVHA